MKIKAGGVVRDATEVERNEIDPLPAWRESCVVTAFQAKAALLAADLLARAEAIVSDSDDVTKLAWSYAKEWPRNSPTIATLAGQLGMTDDDLDALFKAAERIEV